MTLETVQRFASRLDRRHHLAVEPVENMYWFLGEVERHVGSVHVAHPLKVRLVARSRVKTDHHDAQVLADLLRVGYLPDAYYPPPDIRELRSLVYHRYKLVGDRTRVKNRALHLFNGEGIRIPGRDSFGKKGREVMDTISLPGHIRYQVDDRLSELDMLTHRIGEVETLLRNMGSAYPAIQWLRSIPGVGEVIAISLIALVGDIRRFRNCPAFGRFTGLTPGSRDSGGTTRSCGITHEGRSMLRGLLLQAAPHFQYRCSRASELFLRIRARSSLQKAKVAVAHMLARIIHHVCTEERSYCAS